MYSRKYFTDITWRSTASGIPGTHLSSLMLSKTSCKICDSFTPFFLSSKIPYKKKLPCSNFAMQTMLISSVCFHFSLQHFTSFSLIRCCSIVLVLKENVSFISSWLFLLITSDQGSLENLSSTVTQFNMCISKGYQTCQKVLAFHAHFNVQGMWINS